MNNCHEDGDAVWLGESVSTRYRSADWLTADMARALAATTPPLKVNDIMQAAEQLAVRRTPVTAINWLLDHGADLLIKSTATN
jgi:hypothetical protein